MVEELIYLIKEEWTYHLINLVILIFFSVLGAYRSMRVTLAEENKTYLKEFLKSFGVLFALYCLYILFRAGYLTP